MSSALRARSMNTRAFALRTSGRIGLVEKIHGAELVRCEHFAVFVRVSGNEDDGGPLREIAVSDTPSHLEPMHRRHVHVEQQECEIAFRQQAQRRLTRARGEHPNAEPIEDGCERD